ncbi:D-alanyl-D-alanine carboxypeptidase/D-alanyl-D-alanine-endopeptidase [Mycobacteroides abscessus subsp. abscessus]|nr:D-alanyl-D-alanine carboxypeptidase/D-alanyl-D-alanine-endopeptidase [Mycobacteroides abscessus subsp. abscessus]
MAETIGREVALATGRAQTFSGTVQVNCAVRGSISLT